MVHFWGGFYDITAINIGITGGTDMPATRVDKRKNTI